MAEHEFKTAGTNTPEEPGKMADVLGRGGERLGERMDTLGENARDAYTKGRDRVDDIGHTLVDHMKAQPVRSLLIATGVGLVLGAILVRRR